MDSWQVDRRTQTRPIAPFRQAINGPERLARVLAVTSSCGASASSRTPAEDLLRRRLRSRRIPNGSWGHSTRPVEI